MIEDLSASRRKLIASLRQAKHRRRAGLFVVEGARSVLDTIGSFEFESVIATSAWIEQHGIELPDVAIFKASRSDLERISSLTTPQEVMAVCRIPCRSFDREIARNEIVVALDGVQDPGNLGTIVRTCDWFGVSTMICSTDTVDVYNPKVVQSTMGALSRVDVHYVDLEATLIEMIEDGVRIYGTFLDGEDIYDSGLSYSGVIVMGNEGNGISDRVARHINNRLYIPAWPSGRREHVESLNVSMSTAITLAEFRRRQQNHGCVNE